MNRADRRASASRGRNDRIAAFRDRAGAGGLDTSLMPAGEHRSDHGNAISNWLFSEPAARPTCFACGARFSPSVRPGAFLCATAVRAPGGGVAVAGICSSCWDTKTPEAIEAAALAALHRQLGARGFG
jgi:hypothetical protein